MTSGDGNPNRWMSGAEAAARAVADVDGAPAPDKTAGTIARDVARGVNYYGRGVDASEPAVLIRDFYSSSMLENPVVRDLWNSAGDQYAYALPTTVAELFDLLAQLGYSLSKKPNLLLHDREPGVTGRRLDGGASETVGVGPARQLFDNALDARSSTHQSSSRSCEGVPAPSDHTVEGATDGRPEPSPDSGRDSCGGSDAGGAASPLGEPRLRSTPFDARFAIEQLWTALDRVADDSPDRVVPLAAALADTAIRHGNQGDLDHARAQLRSCLRKVVRDAPDRAAPLARELARLAEWKIQ